MWAMLRTAARDTATSLAQVAPLYNYDTYSMGLSHVMKGAIAEA
jgi:hypothetical protein